MKKITILFMIIGLFIVKSSFAGSAGLFTYDAKAVKSELATLNAVNQFVEQNDVTYSEMLRGNMALASNLNYGNIGVYGIKYLEPPLGIPSWIWGASFGLVGGLTGCFVYGCIGASIGAPIMGGAGVLLVYVLTEDKVETKKAFYGCSGMSVAVAGSMALIIALYGALVLSQ